MQLAGKTVLITGGATRIGAVISRKLSQNGAKLAIHFHQNREPLGEVEGIFFQADLTRRDEIEKLAAAVEKKLGPIDILINNAAVFEPTKFLEISEADWDRHLNLNLKVPFLLSQAVARGMLSKKEGKIINLTDYTAIKPSKDYLPYNVSKGGLVTLTKALARELAPHIQVNAIALGPTLPPENYSEEKKEAVADKTLARRWGNAEEVANMVRFLIEDCDYATGSVFYIEGGKLLA